MDAQQNPVDEDTTTNQNFQEIYIKEEPLEEDSEDCDLYESILQNIKEEYVSDNDNEIDKECDNSDNLKSKGTKSYNNIISLYNLCEDKPALLQKLQEWNLIPSSQQCSKCGASMKFTNYDCEGWRWSCGNKYSRNKQKKQRCGNAISFRNGTFFSRSKLSIFKILAFVNLWVGNATILLIQEQLELSRSTCVHWATFCRDTLLTYFMDRKTKLGGPGRVVDIDESKFGKRKYLRGRHVGGQSVFGGYERGTGRVFMITVDDRGADSLIPLIEKWIEPGTTIVSDFWKAHKCLGRHGYLHLKENQSVTFSDPDTKVHNNSIELSWRAAKEIMKNANIPGNLARYIFHKKCAELKLNRTEEYFRLAGATFDATRLVPEEEEQNDIDTEDLEF